MNEPVSKSYKYELIFDLASMSITSLMVIYTGIHWAMGVLG